MDRDRKKTRAAKTLMIFKGFFKLYFYSADIEIVQVTLPDPHFVCDLYIGNFIWIRSENFGRGRIDGNNILGYDQCFKGGYIGF